MPATRPFARRSNENTAARAPAARALLLVRVDDVSRLPLLRVQHDALARTRELLEVVRLHVPELDKQHAAPRPFAVLAEFHLADHGIEGGLGHARGGVGLAEAI